MIRRVIHALIVLATLLTLSEFSLRAVAHNGTSTGGTALNTAYPIPGDRWLEIDLYWFEQKDIPGSVRTFWDRFQPLYEGVGGYRGVILNVGWTVACVMEWSGNLDQRIDLPQGSGQQKWVDQRGPYTGTTDERQRQFRARLAKPQRRCPMLSQQGR